MFKTPTKFRGYNKKDCCSYCGRPDTRKVFFNPFFNINATFCNRIYCKIKRTIHYYFNKTKTRL